MTYKVLRSCTFFTALLLSACGSSSDSSDAVFERAPEVANQTPAQIAGAVDAAPPQSGPVSGTGPDLITPYKRIGDLELGAHLFYPEGHTIDDEVAVLVFMHGGALRRGSPAQGYELAELFTPKGIAVAAIQYRLLDSNAETLDQLIADAKSSVRWLRTNADALGIDPHRVVMSGHSAGAYLALTTSVIDKFDEPFENLQISSVPDAMILWSVPVVRTDDPEHSMVPEGFTMADFTPANYSLEASPPALFIHGNADATVAYEPAMEFESKYSDAGNESEFRIVEGADHFFRNPEHRRQLFELFDNYLAENGFYDL